MLNAALQAQQYPRLSLYYISGETQKLSRQLDIVLAPF